MQKQSFYSWPRQQLFVLVLSVLTSGFAQADVQDYEVHVDGMVCAFCAYTVSKNLATLPGVVADSVQIDLMQGVASLQSAQSLDNTRVEQTFSDSGFTVTDIFAVDKTSAVPHTKSQIAKVILETKQIGSELADQLLDALGVTATSKASELRIVASSALEEAEILKPLIAGRQRAIKVRYESVDQDIVEVTLYQ